MASKQYQKRFTDRRISGRNALVDVVGDHWALAQSIYYLKQAPTHKAQGYFWNQMVCVKVDGNLNFVLLARQLKDTWKFRITSNADRCKFNNWPTTPKNTQEYRIAEIDADYNTPDEAGNKRSKSFDAFEVAE